MTDRGYMTERGGGHPNDGGDGWFVYLASDRWNTRWCKDSTDARERAIEALKEAEAWSAVAHAIESETIKA